jgi:hypothetical protein
VPTAVLRERCSGQGLDRDNTDKALNRAIQLLVDEGRIDIKEPERLAPPGDRRGQRKVRLTAGPAAPAPEPEAPTARTQQIANLISRHPVTEAEAEFIRALLRK